MRHSLLNERARFDALSPREREVLTLTLADLAPKEIAFRLGISPTTVCMYRLMAWKKLGVKGTVELARFAIRAGLITAE